MSEDSLEQPSPLKVVPTTASNYGDPLTDEELKFFIDWPRHFPTDSKFTEERIANMAQELRALRAWKAHLGDPDTWFEKALLNPEILHAAWNGVECSCGSCALHRSASALVERAKETA